VGTGEQDGVARVNGVRRFARNGLDRAVIKDEVIDCSPDGSRADQK
jgi:hypothetical protein